MTPTPGRSDKSKDSDSRVKRGSPLQRLERHLWRRVLAGFLVLVPLGITFLVIRFIVNSLDNLLKPLVEDTPLDFTGIGLATFAAGLYIVGVIVILDVKFGRRAVNLQHAVLTRVPVVKSIYGVAHQAAGTLSATSEGKFNRVVFVEWPRPGVWSIGFVTGRLPPVDGTGISKVALYIPGVPPTSGVLSFVSESEIINSDMTVEDAMKLIFSGGMVTPTRPAPSQGDGEAGRAS